MNALTRFSVLSVLAIAVAACGAEREPVAVKADQNEEFAAYAVDLVDRFLDRSPEWSIYAGRYDNAGRLTVPDEERRADDLAFVEAELKALDRFDSEALDASNRTDYALIRN